MSETVSRPSFPIVAIGASAGGLYALEQFFDNMPPDSGMAFVVIQHLSPDFKSLMDDILSRRTTMRIRRVEDGMALEPDTICLIPPKCQMTVMEGLLHLRDKLPQPYFELSSTPLPNTPENVRLPSSFPAPVPTAHGVFTQFTGKAGLQLLRLLNPPSLTACPAAPWPPVWSILNSPRSAYLNC